MVEGQEKRISDAERRIVALEVVVQTRDEMVDDIRKSLHRVADDIRGLASNDSVKLLSEKVEVISSDWKAAKASWRMALAVAVTAGGIIGYLVKLLVERR